MDLEIETDQNCSKTKNLKKNLNLEIHTEKWTVPNAAHIWYIYLYQSTYSAQDVRDAQRTNNFTGVVFRKEIRSVNKNDVK